MNFAVLGSFGQRVLAPGWTNETALALIGGGDFDLTNVPPGANARLTVIAILGGIDIKVDQGTQVTMSGGSFLGSRKVGVAAGDGPSMTVRAFAVLGHVKVTS